MDFIIRKSKKHNRTSVNIKDVENELKLSILRKQLREAEATIQKLEERPEMSEKDIINIINKEAIRKGDIMNITSASSIEKDNDIKVGTLYFNKAKESVRLKTKDGWKTLKFE